MDRPSDNYNKLEHGDIIQKGDKVAIHGVLSDVENIGGKYDANQMHPIYRLSTPTGEGQKPPAEPSKTSEKVVSELPPPPIETPPQTPTPPETPIPPSVPPPEESMPQPEDPVKKVIQALKEAKPLRKEQEAIYKAERGRRIAKAKAMGRKLAVNKAHTLCWGHLKGECRKFNLKH